MPAADNEQARLAVRGTVRSLVLTQQDPVLKALRVLQLAIWASEFWVNGMSQAVLARSKSAACSGISAWQSLVYHLLGYIGGYIGLYRVV